MSNQPKRRPFGNAASHCNAVVPNVSKGAGKKPTASIDPRGAEPFFKTSRSKQTARSATTTRNQNDRRKSKTPKMHNLSTVGGAYNFQDYLVDRQISRTASKISSKPKPDPSPLKRPDPSSKIVLATNAAAKDEFITSPAGTLTNNIDSSLVAMTSKHRGSFIASTVGRLFKPQHSSSSKTAASSKLSECDTCSDMDVDSEFSSPDMTSPLITSPYGKPDPESMELITARPKSSRVAVAAVTRDTNVSRPTMKMAAPKIQSTDKGGKTTVDSTIYGPKKSTITAVFNSRSTTQQLQSRVSKQVLARVRAAPVDDKYVLDAILDCSNRKRTQCNHASQTETSGLSLVGSTVGGASLQRSASIDGSEITLPSISYAPKTTRGYQSVGTSSIFRNAGSISLKNSQNSIPSSNVTTQILRHPTADERERISMQIGSQLQSGYTHPSQILLPAGWQVRMSKSKGKPYYVHPDFGSTWFYPGLVVGPHVAVQNGVYMDQSVAVVDRFTSHACTFQKSNNASHTMESAKTLDSPKCGTVGNVANDKHSSNTTSFTSKDTDDYMVLLHSIDSQVELFSNDSLVNSSGDIALVKKTEKGQMATNEVIDNTVTTSKQGIDNNDQDVDFETEQDKMDDIDSSEGDNQSLFTPVNYNDVEFGAKHDKFDHLHNVNLEVDKYESSSTTDYESQDDLAGLDLVNDGYDIDQNSLLSPIDANKDDGSSSLSSDHVEMDLLLSQSSRGQLNSPLTTIKELMMRESSGKQSSQVSLDGASVDNQCVNVQSSDKSPFQSSVMDDLSEVSDDIEKYVIDKALNPSFDDDELDHNGFNVARDDFHGGDANSTIDSISIVHENKPCNQIEASTKHIEKRKKLISTKKERRKTFPPGPLCSLQMLELIEDGSMNTPLWRMCKRKRSTFTSLKRAQAKREGERKKLSGVFS